MAIVTTDDKYYKDIANAIRGCFEQDDVSEYFEKSKEQFKPAEMTSAVIDVRKSGYECGHFYGWEAGLNEGLEEGYISGYQDGYVEGNYEGEQRGIGQGIEQGKQAEYDRFWNAVQENGNRTNYAFAFAGESWDAETFKPKYPIAPIICYNMFAYWGKYNTASKPLVDFREFPIDFSKAEYAYSAFFNNVLVCAVGEIDLAKNTRMQSFFEGAVNLYTVEKLILPVGADVEFNNTFANCKALQHITVEGVIGQSVSFGWSPLTADSIRSIVGALSATATGKTVTFKRTAKEAAFTDEEWAQLIGQKPNWTVVLT